VLGGCAFGEYAELLGYPIKPGARRTLYLAMDRPQQAARSSRRMVGEGWRSELDAKQRMCPTLVPNCHDR
jgi:replicative DNA helicase